LITSVFCTSTKTETLGSTRASASTAKIALKKLEPEPPYCSGISTPITPSSNSAGKRLTSSDAFSSISDTFGPMRCFAKSSTVSKNSRSSSEMRVSAVTARQ